MLLCDAGSITLHAPVPSSARYCIFAAPARACSSSLGCLHPLVCCSWLAGRHPGPNLRLFLFEQKVDPKALCFQMARTEKSGREAREVPRGPRSPARPETYSLETWRCGCMPRRYTGFKKLLGLGRESSLLFDADLAKLLLHLLTNAGSSHGIECR